MNVTQDDAKAIAALTKIKPYLSKGQAKVLSDERRGEEKSFFVQKIIETNERIESMPKLYEQDGKGDEAIAALHYFLNGSDWYITEKSSPAEAFGYAILNGDTDFAELGYISIEEIVDAGAEMDLHFAPCQLGSIKEKHAEIDRAFPDIGPLT